MRDVAQSVSMIDIVRRHVTLKKAGGSYKGLCPFHDEKSPSFHVNEARKSFHCFGCGAGGDAIEFIMKIEGRGFVEAVQELASSAGILLPEKELSPAERKELNWRDQLYKASEIAASYFSGQLRGGGGERGREEIEKRGVPPELQESFRLGVAPDAWDGLLGALRAAGVPPKAAEEAGLIVPRSSGDGWYDRFRNRLIFPIRAPGGKVVAFGGRTLGDDDAKYINSPESPIYRKSETLYGLHAARTAIHRADRVLVVEGYFDVLGLAKAGLKYAVAPCGTALTKQQLQALKRHTERIVLFFDGDSAGQRAAFKSLRLCLETGLWPLCPHLPEGMDPDDYVREHGAEAMQGIVEQARPLLDVFLDHRLPDGAADARTRKEALDDICELLSLMSDGLVEPYYRQYNELPLRLGLDRGDRLKEHVLRFRRDRHVRAERDRARAPRVEAPGAVAPVALDDEFGPPPDEAYFDEEGWPLDEGPDSLPAPPGTIRPSATATPPPTPAELQLIKLMIQDIANLGPELDALGVLSWLQHPDVEAAAGRLLRCWRESRTPVGMELLEGLLDPRVISPISADLATEERWLADEQLEEATRETLVRLHLDWLESRIRRASLEIDSASRRGNDFGQIRPLLEAKRDLERQRAEAVALLRGGTPNAG